MSTEAPSPSLPTSPPEPASVLSSARLGALGLVLAIGAIIWFFRVLVRDAEAADFTRVDPSSSRVDFGPGWVDVRWEQQLAARLAALPPLRADDPLALAQVESALFELPFVEGLGESRVLWPDGLRVEIKLRQPVGCVRAGELFLAVSAEGVVLPGAWSTPPARTHGFLPLIALEEEVRREVFEGNVLDSAGALDGLAVAAALERGLAADDWVRLGRIVIDARAARRASVEEPGTVLWLEAGRRINFGRSPNLDAPGELPAELKCASLSKALRLAESGEPPIDWELCDVRWDRPEILPRGGLEEPAKLQRRAPR